MKIETQPPPVTVVGAGIVGICTALALVERGASVKLIDRDEPGQGASFGNAGVISPWSVVPQSLPWLWKNIPGWLIDPEGPIRLPLSYMPRFLPWGVRFLYAGRAKRVREISDAMETLNTSNVELFKRCLAGSGHETLIEDSYYVHVYRNPKQASVVGLSWDLRREKGAQMEVVDDRELRRLEPAISPDYKAAILIKGQARARDPGRIGKVLTEKFLSLGGTVLRATVRGFEKSDSTWLITTDQGTFPAEKIVVAAGAWSANLLKPLGLSMPLQAERGYHIMFENPGVELNNSVMDADLKFVSSSMEGGLRSAGTAEFAGRDAPPTEKRARMLIGQTKKMLPDLNTEVTESWMGVRPSFPDSLPAIGPIPGQSGLFAAFGHSHYGLMMAPKTGELVADAVLDARSNTDLSPYRIDRF